jgi:hypothetical protein
MRGFDGLRHTNSPVPLKRRSHRVGTGSGPVQS